MATDEDAREATLSAIVALAKRAAKAAEGSTPAMIEAAGVALKQSAEAYAWLTVPGRDH